MTEKKMRAKRNEASKTLRAKRDRVSNTIRRLGIGKAIVLYGTKVSVYRDLIKQYRSELSTLSSGSYRDKLIRKIAQASCKLERAERFLYLLILDEIHQRNRPHCINKD
jgi:hypothetical protein